MRQVIILHCPTCLFWGTFPLKFSRVECLELFFLLLHSEVPTVLIIIVTGHSLTNYVESCHRVVTPKEHCAAAVTAAVPATGTPALEGDTRRSGPVKGDAPFGAATAESTMLLAKEVLPQPAAALLLKVAPSPMPCHAVTDSQLLLLL